MTNRLEAASSTYLRQHANNPVDWWPWGAEALAEAARLDRPIFLSVGYAACHWCHVMAHESFENDNIAALMNSKFVAIKVDREERPDVDALYMAATQLMTGQGGWPMSVFLLPDGRPFMAGTYYPPIDRQGQVGFSRLLTAMDDAWTHQRDAVERQATEITQSLEREVRFIDHLAPSSAPLELAFTRQQLRDELVSRVDENGGFGDAPKFPRPSYIDALLDYEDAASRDAVARTLDAMARGGLYDHLRGGFARYSVDAEWHIPHFEKMLSDQALLARTYLRAAQKRPDHPEWRDAALDTLRFVASDLFIPGGFASSLDADAGNVEGSHVTWTPDEVLGALQASHRTDDLAASLSRWRIESPGQFDGRSIPRLRNGEPFLTPPELRPALSALRNARALRRQPGRDEKVILEWNAMIASAFVRSDDEQLMDHGLTLLANLSSTHFDGMTWWRTEQQQAHAAAADVSWLLDAYVDAFEATGDDSWLTIGTDVAHYLLKHYWDGVVPTTSSPHEGAGVFAQSDLVTDISMRSKEIFDGATPSSHAVACRALARLALCRGNTELLVVAQRLVEVATTILVSHPGAVPDLLDAAGYALDGVEIVVPGPRNDLSNHVRSLAMPRSVLITGSGSSPLLVDRRVNFAYVCRGGVCQRPTSDVHELNLQLQRPDL